jgi:hypothetical protein
MAELLRISSLRSPIPLDPLNLTRSPRGETGESFTPLGNVIGIGTGNGIETGDINKEKPKPNFKIPEQKALYTHFTTPDKNDRYREWLTTHPNADVEFEEWSARTNNKVDYY